MGDLINVSRATLSVPDSMLAGFIESDFPSAIYEAAARCLRYVDSAVLARPDVAVCLMTAAGDSQTRHAIDAAIADGSRLSPLLLVQAVPSSILGKIAKDWNLHGPVITLGLEVPLDNHSHLEMLRDILLDDTISAVLSIRQVEIDEVHHSAAEAVLFARPHIMSVPAQEMRN